VRLIDADGAQLGVVEKAAALGRAREQGLDLVVVAADAHPPVCRIMDFGKYKYRQKKKLHQGKQRVSSQIKEVRLSPKIQEHDLQFKLGHAREFLAKGHKVLLNMRFRGREMAHVDLGQGMLNKILRALEEVARIEQMPKMENKRLQVLLTPVVRGK
jgi:translation initiation factor IF-3